MFVTVQVDRLEVNAGKSSASDRIFSTNGNLKNFVKMRKVEIFGNNVKKSKSGNPGMRASVRSRARWLPVCCAKIERSKHTEL